jgi:hypothetical protein
MKRFAIDLALAAAMATLPALTDASRIEVVRLAILGGVYAAVALLGYARLIRSAAVRRVLDAGVALFALSIAWFVSFAAWGHSTEVGLYLLSGTAILFTALWPRREPRQPRVDTEARRLRLEQQALFAVWQ